ncbi:MAG: hypothetical protein EA397_13710 [Deltaproteobacteria bacterium]|nr:MAG: hypothetical protein EA397_13710 [Deltaproteobacteria bacterium]
MTHQATNLITASSPKASLLPEALVTGTLGGRQITSHAGLERLTAALGGDSFALFEAVGGGQFQKVATSHFQGWGQALAGKVDAHLLLRRLAATQGPVLLTREVGGPVARMMERFGVQWVLSMPARTCDRTLGVLLVAGRAHLPPTHAEVTLLAPLAPILAASLGRLSTVPAYEEPTHALRCASKRHSRHRRWTKVFRSLASLW